MFSVKKFLGVVVAFSLLTVQANPVEPTQYVSTRTFITLTAGVIALPCILYWYHNYYKVNHTTLERLVKEYAQEKTQALFLLSIADASSDLTRNIHSEYKSRYDSHLTFHDEISSCINNLTYYRNALLKKRLDLKIADNRIINECEELLTNLTDLHTQLENNAEFKKESATHENNESCLICASRI